MAIVVYPVDVVAGSPSYTGRMLRQTQSVFMSGATSARPFAVTSGVRPGTSTTTVTATSTTWTMGLHAGILDLEAAVEAGPYAYAVNTAQTGAVTAAHATLPRIDLVWVRLDDPAEADGSSVPAVVAGYTAGVAASTPAAPATPSRCMVLAWINVPASGGGSPTVTWKAPYAVAASSPTPPVYGSSASYPGTATESVVTGCSLTLPAGKWDVSAVCDASWATSGGTPPIYVYRLRSGGLAGTVIDSKAIDIGSHTGSIPCALQALSLTLAATTVVVLTVVTTGPAAGSTATNAAVIKAIAIP